MVPREGYAKPCGKRSCLRASCWLIISIDHCAGIGEERTMTPTVIEEYLGGFCGLLGNADDVAVSTTGTTAFEGTLALHGNERAG